MSVLATFSVLSAAPAHAQPHPEPATAPPHAAASTLTASAQDVLAGVRPADRAPDIGRCPTDAGLLGADLRLAGLDARAANYAIYAINDDCDESTE